jgi:TusA-related sulfurtransferase
MKTSFAALAIALSGSAMGAPVLNGTRIASTSSPASTPAHLSTDPPLPNPFASITKSLSSATPSSGTLPFSSALSPTGSAAKRGEALSIPTDLPSLVSDAQSVAAALASAGAGAQKRGESLSIPTDLPSLVSDAQSAAAALASAGAQKRGEALSIPTDLPSLVSDAQSVAAALASAGGQKRAEQTIPILTPTGLPASSSTLYTRPASSTVGSSSGAVFSSVASSTGTPSHTKALSFSATPSSGRPSPTSIGSSLFSLLA